MARSDLNREQYGDRPLFNGPVFAEALLEEEYPQGSEGDCGEQAGGKVIAAVDSQKGGYEYSHEEDGVE